MINTPFIISFIIISSILSSGCGKHAQSEQTAGENTFPITITNSVNRPIVFDSEIAKTDPEREKGLSNRSNLPKNKAMLFIFSTDNRWSFWMKDTLIPLDMIFISSNGTIVDIAKNTTIQSLNAITPSSPCRYVLEINGGLSTANNINIGDAADLSKVN